MLKQAQIQALHFTQELEIHNKFNIRAQNELKVAVLHNSLRPRQQPTTQPKIIRNVLPHKTALRYRLYTIFC